MSIILYSIEKIPSEVNNTLVIGIHEGEKSQFSYQFLPKQRPLTRQLLTKLATDRDHALLDLLVKEEQRYLKLAGKPFSDTTTPLNLVHVSFGQTESLLKFLALSGKLYFQNKAIVIDLFGKAEFSFYLTQKEENTLSVQGKISTSKEEFSLQEVDFLCGGPPHWFIKGYLLKFISTDIAWKSLKKAYECSWILNTHEKQEFLDEFEPFEGGNPPKIIFADNQLRKSEKPLPILILKDRAGAFADLWIDYGLGRRVALHDPLKSFPRDINAEQQLEKDLLETDFIKKLVGTTHYYSPLDKVAKSLTFLLEVGWQILDHQGNRVVHQTALELEMKEKPEAIHIKGKVRYESFEADIGAVVGAFNRRERFVTLATGTVGLLPEKWDHTELSTLVEEGEVVQDEIKLNKSRFGALAELWQSPSIHVDSSLQDLKVRLEGFSGIQETLPGAVFKGTLRPYQQEGLNWLSFLYDYGFHGLLADDMGLGKTVQVLAFLSQLKLTAPILIVLPTTLLFNWKKEIEKFLPGYSVYLHHSLQRSKEVAFLSQQTIILTSYTTLRQDIALLSAVSYQCVILDEAQVMKNVNTQIAQALYLLNARFRLSITGTPIENHLGELWSHFHFLIPDLFGSEKVFSADVQASSLDTRYLDRIKRKIKPFFLRRRKEEVAQDLPEKIEQTVYVEMDTEQRQIYDEFLSGVRGNLLKKVSLDGIGKHRMEVLEAILRLRQICCHPLLAGSLVDEQRTKTSAKMETLLEDISTALEEGKKVLIYSQFTSMLQILAKAFQERLYPYVYLDGSTVDREKIVDRFQNDAAVPLFLISLKAGGVGLNLTAADYVLLFDPWWNEAVEEQAIGRAHRIGRKNTVIAKRYIAVESIEEKIMKLKGAKRSLVESLFQDEPIHPGITEEDLLFLLADD